MNAFVIRTTHAPEMLVSALFAYSLRIYDVSGIDFDFLHWHFQVNSNFLIVYNMLSTVFVSQFP